MLDPLIAPSGATLPRGWLWTPVREADRVPEGHTLHHHCRQHDRWFSGRVVRATSPQGRFADGAARLDGQRVVEVAAKGKHAFWTFEGGDVLHVHLGLYGRFRTHRAPPPEPRGQVRWRVEGGDRALDLIGPTRCRLLTSAQHAEELARLGEDPLRADADPERALDRLGRTARPLGAALLDQSIIAGIGNVYRAELLFVAGLDPYTPARAVPREGLARLWRNAVTLLEVGAKHGSIRVVGEAVEGAPDPGGDLARFEVPSRYGRRRDRLWVYKRATCKVCGGDIARGELGARTLYYCPRCQGFRNTAS